LFHSWPATPLSAFLLTALPNAPCLVLPNDAKLNRYLSSDRPRLPPKKQTTQKSMRIQVTLKSLLLAVSFALMASLAQAQKAPVTVGLLPKLDTDPYFQVAKTGAEEAQKEIGGSVLQEAPSQATAEAQIEFINNLVSQKVGVIAIAGNDANAVAPALKRAAKQGVKIISYDSDVARDARTLFLNQAKGDSLAEMMLVSMGELIGYEGEFAILSSTPTATNQNAWIAFMKARMAADPKYAKMKLVQIAYGEESEQINQQQALALAQAFPNLKGIIIPAGIGLPAAARAMEQAGLLGKLKLTGLAPATLIKKYIQNGTVQDIWWNVKDLGYLTYYAAQAVASGQITGKEGETFKAGRLGEFTVGPGGEVVLGPAKIVTPANVEEFKF
jgi:rhamnose transport system substrate-binding protein